MNKRNLLFRDKNIVITGASSGIGKLLALKLSEYGCNLLLVARRESKLHEVQQACKDVNPNVKVLVCMADLSKAEGGQKITDFACDFFPQIDVIVANAGASMHAKVSESSLVVYEQMMNANYYTLVNTVLPMLPVVKKSNGMLVAITSIQSLIGVPYHAAYVAAKHATGGFLESLELEEPDIQIVEVMPGWVSGTDIRSHAINGYGKPVENRSTHKRHSRSSITIEECVESFIDGIVNKRRLVYRPKFWRNILFVKYAMRGYLHSLITKRQSFSSSS